MEKVGELKTRLSERLAQRQAEELAEVATLTEDNLTQLSERLTKHVSAELSTTGDAIRQQSAQINALLRSQQSALEQQQTTVDALKRLSLADLEQIREGLNDAITLAQGEAIKQAIEPLRTALEQLKQDGETLGRVTFRGWLKPVCIGLVICLGMGGLVWGAASLLQVEINNKLQDLQALKQEISQAEATLKRLPKGVRFVKQENDKRYIVAKSISDPFTITEGQFKGRLAVEVQ
ncbi:hypothetical protein ACK306_20290 [Aeromonas caviae]|jgi:hypothetical protein